MIKNKFPLVSVVLPVFNREKTLGASVDSVLNQSYTNYEIIIVDDGSSDSSAHIAQQYAENYSRIRIILFQKNKGAQKARNIGLSNSGGEYIVFLDSDDILRADFLQIMINLFLARPWLGLIASSCVHFVDSVAIINSISQNTTKVFEKYKIDLVSLRSYLERSHSWPTSAACWRKSSLLDINGWDESLSLWQDWNLNARYLAGKGAAVFLHEPLMFYRLSADGISRQITTNKHKQFLASRVSAWNSCDRKIISINSDLWVRHFCGAIRLCRNERGSIIEVLVAIYYTILTSPSIKTVKCIVSNWNAEKS